jgi:hypothetical protein
MSGLVIATLAALFVLTAGVGIARGEHKWFEGLGEHVYFRAVRHRMSRVLNVLVAALVLATLAGVSIAATIILIQT